MYDRTIDGGELTFSVSGKLWKKSLVMEDAETGSLWSQILGKSMEGPLVGKQLEMIPSVVTDFRTWRTNHPDSTVSSFHVMTYAYKNSYHKSRRERFLIGLADGPNLAKAWKYVELDLQPVVNDQFGEKNVVVFFAAEIGQATIFNRELNGQVLTFEIADNKILDQQTGTTWNMATGEAIQGKLKGGRLIAEAGVICFAHAWETYYPKSEYWKADP